MKIFNKPRCTEIKSKNNLRTQLGLLSDTRQQLYSNTYKHFSKIITTKTSKLQSHISQQNIVQNEQFAYFSCKNENI